MNAAKTALTDEINELNAQIKTAENRNPKDQANIDRLVAQRDAAAAKLSKA